MRCQAPAASFLFFAARSSDFFLIGQVYALTQVQLAGLAGMGPRFVVELEGGKPPVAINKVIQVLAALGVRLQSLRGRG